MSRWQPHEEFFLRVNYDSMTHTQIGLALGRNRTQVKDKAHALGLYVKKNKKQREKEERRKQDVREEHLQQTYEELKEYL